MIKTRITCSACHGSVTINGETRKTIGSPFTKCPWCGANVITNTKKEWNTMNKVQKFFWIMNPGYGSYFFIVLGCIFLSCMIGMALNISESFQVLFVWIFTLISLVTSSTIIYKLRIGSDSIKLAIRNSNLRLRDPEYRALLEKAGFTIYGYDTSKEDDQETEEDGVVIDKNDIMYVKTEWDYKNFMHRSAVARIVETYLMRHESCTAKEFVELMDGVSGVVAEMLKLPRLNNLLAEEDVAFGTKGTMKTIRIKWNNGLDHDKEFVVFYDNRQAFYFLISGGLYEMYMASQVRGMDTLEKEFNEDGQYVIDHIEEICDYPIIADYPGFNGFYQNGLRNQIVQYLKESIK